MSSPTRKPPRARPADDAPPASQRREAGPSDSRLPPDAASHAQALSEITVHDTEPGAFYIASWKGVVMVRWESAATGGAVERLAKVSADLAADEREPARSNVHIIADGAGLPTPDARAGFIRLMKQHAGRLACVAIVVGGTGFLASAMRSLMTGMRLLAPRSFNYRLHGSIHEVVEWLPAEHFARTGEQLDPRRLAEVLASWEKPSGVAPRAPSK
jgi:hypothetical protein